MSLVIQSVPIWIYSSPYKNASALTCVLENEARLKEYGVDPSRIVIIPDNSYLTRELQKVKKAALIFVGGAQSHLSIDLKEVNKSKLVHEAVSSGKLNIWGQCAGSMILCEQYEGLKKKDDWFFCLLPISFGSSAYPVRTHAYEGGDNRKLSVLRTGIDDGDYASKKDGRMGDEFRSFWNEGPIFRKSCTEDTPSGDEKPYRALSHYTDTPEANLQHEISCMAEVTGLYGKGRVIASAIHLEISSVKVPEEKDSIEILKADKVRIQQLQKRYELLDIQKTPQ